MGARLANIERTEDAMRALAAEETDGLNRAARRSNIDVRLLPQGAKELGATERAMRTLGNRLGQAGVATGNMNANYNRHRRDWAVMMRAETTAAAASRRAAIQPSGGGGGAQRGRGGGGAAEGSGGDGGGGGGGGGGAGRHHRSPGMAAMAPRPIMSHGGAQTEQNRRAIVHVACGRRLPQAGAEQGGGALRCAAP